MICCMMFIMLSVSISSAYALTVKIAPEKIELPETEKFEINVTAEEVSDLGGFQFSINYDPAVVAVESVIQGAFLKNTGRTVMFLDPVIDNAVGKLSYGAFSFGNNPGPNGSGILATVKFTVLDPNCSTLTLDDLEITNTDGSFQSVNTADAVLIKRYAVNFTSGGNGKITGDTSQTIKCGEDCASVTAVPDEGYQFGGWNGDHTGDENPLTIGDVRKDMNVIANFALPDECTVNFTSGEHGKITGDISQNVKNGGNCTPVKAEPDACYQFAGWNVDYTGEENALTVENVIKDMTIKAEFVRIPPNLSDAVRALKILTGMQPEKPICSDVSGNRKVGMDDVIYILQFVAEMRKSS